MSGRICVSNKCRRARCAPSHTSRPTTWLIVARAERFGHACQQNVTRKSPQQFEMAIAYLVHAGEECVHACSVTTTVMAREFRSASPYMHFGRIRPNLQQDYAGLPHNFT
jgi:hypothetical protein